jgi:hypothetical protein
MYYTRKTKSMMGMRHTRKLKRPNYISLPNPNHSLINSRKFFSEKSLKYKLLFSKNKLLRRRSFLGKPASLKHYLIPRHNLSERYKNNS